MVILTKFLDIVMFATRDLGHNGEKLKKKMIISINNHICPIFHAEDNLSKLQFNFAPFIGPILTIRGLVPLNCKFKNGGNLYMKSGWLGTKNASV
jgi:hypothetical protein